MFYLKLCRLNDITSTKNAFFISSYLGGKWKCSSREDENAVLLSRERDNNATLWDRINEEQPGRRGREREEAGERVQSCLTLSSEHLQRHRRGAEMKRQFSARRGPAAGRK